MCVFCEIVKGNLPSKAVFENEEVFAFLDIKPTNPGHVLIVPKNIQLISKKLIAIL